MEHKTRHDVKTPRVYLVWCCRELESLHICETLDSPLTLLSLLSWLCRSLQTLHKKAAPKAFSLKFSTEWQGTFSEKHFISEMLMND